MGSVLCGAITYIGNGPNFMTKAVADAAGVPMPSFGGYLRWSLLHLVPILAAMVLLFLTDAAAWKVCGALLALAVLGRAFWLIRRNPLAPLRAPGAF